MPLFIPGAPLTLTLSASGLNTILATDSVDYTVTTRKFDRKEFSNTYLMSLPESDGSEPIFIKNVTNKPVQINWSCGPSTARSILPDDANIDKILKNMLITTYTIIGGPVSPSNLDPWFAVAQDHQLRYDSFQAYLDLFSLKLSINFILNLQNLTFSYLTSTGLTMTGGELFTENNCLIRNLTPGILYTNPSKSSIVCKGWRMTVDVIKGINNERIYQS